MTVATNTAAILAIVIGALVCFSGYRILRVTLGIAGFVVAAAVGAGIASEISGTSQIFLLIVGLVCGVIGAILAALLYKVGVFFLGAGAGALVAGLVLNATSGNSNVLVLVIGGVIGGVFALLMQRTLISILTAFVGAWGVVAGVFQFVGWYDLSVGYLVLRLCGHPHRISA